MGSKKTLLVGAIVNLSLSATLAAAPTQSRIVGGIESKIIDHPFVVSLQTMGSHYCGGTLIAKNFVLTAGHCVHGIAKAEISVVTGSQTHQGSTGETFQVKTVTKHPSFQLSQTSIKSDFAILELSGESKSAPALLISKLADASQESADKSSTAIGWGTTSENGSLAKTLMEVNLPLVSAEECEKSYPTILDDSMICAGVPEGGKDSCQGDSGGPLVVKNIKGEEVLVGVVSWGQGCARPGMYGVYSDVGFARDWIDTVTKPVN